MYKTLLIFKYLRKRRIAWVSLVAVTLCTTMVIVVMSVMSGWLSMFRESARGLTGDIVVQRKGWGGFAEYEKIKAEIEKLPEVSAAVPTIETYGLINIVDRIRAGVQVVGIPIDQIGKVNRFPQSLYRQWTAADDPSLSADEKADARVIKTEQPTFDLPLNPEFYRVRLPAKRDAEGKEVDRQDPATFPGIIVGAGVIGIRPDLRGNIDHNIDAALRAWAQLTVLPVNDQQDFRPEDATPRMYWIVDDSRTGVHERDSNTVYVDFARLQRDLQMGPDEYIDARTGDKIVLPPRTHNLQVALKPGRELDEVVPRVQVIVDQILGQDEDTFDRVTAVSWETLRADFMQAVEKEIVLTTLLFSIISVVAVFLIFCIFYMIVQEKTKDIGIIKSVGASGGGVASIFLGYGLAIGLIGGAAGLLISYLIVHNINEIHTWMAVRLGVEMWSANTYMFDKIPNTLDPFKVSVIVMVAIGSSVAGSIIPAWRAARMNPVEALRWE